ncbi:MAG: response regulator [Chloroflexota bacterium]
MITALIIDDNQITADTLCQMLELLDVQARPAYGPRAAMLALKDFQPDIVFLDVNMPGINGFEVMSYIRRFPGMDSVPVVFVTSDDQPETAGKVRRTGALLMIIKPATIDALELALKKAGLLR